MPRAWTVLVCCLYVAPMFFALAASATTSAADLAAPLLSLQLVNQERKSRGLAPLQHDPLLTGVARAHAEDMAARGYYSHISPEGEDAFKRFVRAGGNWWRSVNENIGYCRNCAEASARLVQSFHEQWMESPGHRANMLDPHSQSFGFGVALSPDGVFFAAQNFAGPGEPRPSPSGATAQAIDPEAHQPFALSLINRLRAERGFAELEGDASLGKAARDLLSSHLGSEAEDIVDFDVQALTMLLPGDAWERWRQLGILVAACGGCGSEPSDADIEVFVQRWVENADDSVGLIEGAFSSAGFALLADGLGRKVAMVVLGAAR